MGRDYSAPRKDFTIAGYIGMAVGIALLVALLAYATLRPAISPSDREASAALVAQMDAAEARSDQRLAAAETERRRGL